MVRLIVYTDEPLPALALKSLISQCDDVALVSVVSDAEGLSQEVVAYRPDVILLTADDGVDWGLLNALRREHVTARIVFWVRDITPEHAYQAMEFGIRGILRKNLPPEMILKCIRKVSEGELWFEKGLTQTFLNGRAIKVSRRQGQLITLVSQGLKNKEIATVMSITEGTVKVALSRLFEKVGARDRFELALLGLRNVQSPAQISGQAGGTSLFIKSEKPAEPARKTAQSQPLRFLVANSSGR